MILPSDFTDIIIRSLSPKVKEILMDFGPHLIVAGGFCRDAMTGREPKDVDIFAVSKRVMDEAIEAFGWQTVMNRKQTANSITFEEFFPKDGEVPIQFITRTYYDHHEELINSFDFSVCQIGVYWSMDHWEGICSSQFWKDIFTEKATYTDPERDEDPGGSLLRMVRFAHRGYKVSENDIANVTGRFFAAVMNSPKEEARMKVKACFRRVGYAGKQELQPEDTGREI